MRRLVVCYKLAWLVEHTLMEVMRARKDARQLDARVEIASRSVPWPTGRVTSPR